MLTPRLPQNPPACQYVCLDVLQHQIYNYTMSPLQGVIRPNVKPTGRYWRYLRRYQTESDIPIGAPRCPSTGDGLHTRMALIGEVDGSNYSHIPDNDPRWPRVCACGYQFKESDGRQIFNDEIYERFDDGVEVSMRSFRPGTVQPPFAVT